MKKELIRQHQGSVETCDRLKEGRDFFLRFKAATTIQINRMLNTASPRDLVRGLRANGMEVKRDYLGINRNGKRVHRYTFIGWAA